jgi:class 3 adenylate cyclase
LNRLLLATTLQEQGYIVQTAENGLEALEKMRGYPFDVILLDLLMPELDGYQVLEIIRDDNILRHIPVIVVSALDEMDSVIRCIEMGATDYLTKPFDPVLLKARLNASLANKRLHDAEQKHLTEISLEREKADRLLLNILPEPIAKQLKQGKQPTAESFPDVSVLFADVADFTPWAAVHTPSEVLELLNSVFSAFDVLVDHYNMEKIKTIGDAYMAAGGLPIPQQNHAEAIAAMALDMLQEFNNLSLVKKEKLELRVGIHCGPVIAGVIGSKKFIYDLWGDTVNTASRLQSHCEPGQIQVSSDFYLRLKYDFEFCERGLTLVRSKGEMLTYLLEGRKVAR